MEARFTVYEIEHGGDLDAALEDLRRAGCVDIVARADFANECMAVACTLPDGVTSPAGLTLTVACL